MIETFGESNLLKLYKHIHKKHFSHDTSNYNNIISKISGIFDAPLLDYQEIEEELEILYTGEKDTWSRRIIRCLLELISLLPPYKENDIVNELDLKIRFINPILKYFLNDVEKKFRLRWPETSPPERKVYHKQVQRPDALITRTSQATYHENVGFAEVKSSLYNNKNRALILDMYRLIYFSKNTIDISKINSPIMIQIVGAKVNVYMQILISRKFYVTLFLFEMAMPLCLGEIKNFIPSIKKLISLNLALVTCNKENSFVDENMITTSKTTPLFEQRIESKVFQGDMDKIQLC